MFKVIFLLLCFDLVLSLKKTELLRIQFKNGKQQAIFNLFEMISNNMIKYQESKNNSNVIYATVDIEFSHKLKNFLYDKYIVFNVEKESYRAQKNNLLEYSNEHLPYKKILKLLTRWRTAYKERIQLYEIGKTINNNSIVVVRLSDQVNLENKNKSLLFIECGIHAREWASVSTCLFIINKFLFDPDYDIILKNHFIDLLIVTNPDGYEYSWTTNRWWRKNRKKVNKNCYGVDLNRNFEIDFVNKNNKIACQETYKGNKPFSEIETSAERDYLKNIEQPIDLFLSFHSYGQIIAYPYGHSKKKSKNWKQSKEILRKVTKNLKEFNNVTYTYGQTFYAIYQSSGGSDDWTCHEIKPKFTFVVELRDKGDYGFFLPESEIRTVGLDGLIILNTIIDYISPNLIDVTKMNQKNLLEN